MGEESVNTFGRRRGGNDVFDGGFGFDFGDGDGDGTGPTTHGGPLFHQLAFINPRYYHLGEILIHNPEQFSEVHFVRVFTQKMAVKDQFSRVTSRFSCNMPSSFRSMLPSQMME
jgi:hypothetical protein